MTLTTADKRELLEMLRHTVLAAAIAVAAPAAAQPPSFGELAAAQAQLPAPTLTERYGADDLRSGELRMPAGRSPFPVALLVHGGCWSSDMGDRSDLAPLGEALRARGIATWNISYRRIGHEGAGWPGTFEDIAGGADHLRGLARRYPLNLSRVSFIGHSSGAHLALWAASRRRLTQQFGSRRPLRPVSAVAIDGPGTLAALIGPDRQICGREVIVPLMGGTRDARPAQYRLATPGDNLPLGVTQLFVLADLRLFMTDYIAATRASGDEVHVIEPTNSDHFNVLLPSNAVGAEVLDMIVQHGFTRRR